MADTHGIPDPRPMTAREMKAAAVFAALEGAQEALRQALDDVVIAKMTLQRSQPRRPRRRATPVFIV